MVNNRGNQARLLNNIAVIHDIKGEYEQALNLYNQSLEIKRQVGDRHANVNTLNRIAVAILSEDGYEYDQCNTSFMLY
ncbi:MAG: tetratricopeptide repeat protein [Nitrososphaeraceae archaeon]|nr:tetratricopeptide repeat protein [Nitrososphaeraceae archaeon]